MLFLNFSSQDFVRRVDGSGVLEEFLNNFQRIPKEFQSHLVFLVRIIRQLKNSWSRCLLKPKYYKNILFFVSMAENSPTKLYSYCAIAGGYTKARKLFCFNRDFHQATHNEGIMYKQDVGWRVENLTKTKIRAWFGQRSSFFFLLFQHSIRKSLLLNLKQHALELFHLISNFHFQVEIIKMCVDNTWYYRWLPYKFCNKPLCFLFNQHELIFFTLYLSIC